MQSTASALSVSDFNIERFVSDATWKDVLIELVRKNELNPWGIDIADIVERYVDAVKGMRVLDLRVPANIILAAAILVRLKSDMLDLEEHAEQEEAQIDFTRPQVAVDPLSLRLRLPQRRRVTLAELIVALEEAMKLKEYREAQTAGQTRTVPLVFARADVEADIEKIYELVENHADKSRMLTYSALCGVAHRENDLLDLFIPLLFLASKTRVLLLQEEFFGEILIALN